MEYYFIGDPEILTGFRFAGVDGGAASGPDTALALFRKITSGRDPVTDAVLPTGACKVLILTEEAAMWLGDELTAWQLSGRYPLVVEVPGTLGRIEGRGTLVDSIQKAIGIRV
ncbi:MAG: ATPase V [Spirochaetaceae bacterium]|jgi:V/A-type H+-transporting ATPase subunit F|nr:ATPase V [Spirochaetaceae bacterium]